MKILFKVYILLHFYDVHGPAPLPSWLRRTFDKKADKQILKYIDW